MEPQGAAHPGILHCWRQRDSVGLEEAAAGVEHQGQLRVTPWLQSCLAVHEKQSAFALDCRGLHCTDLLQASVTLQSCPCLPALACLPGAP